MILSRRIFFLFLLLGGLPAGILPAVANATAWVSTEVNGVSYLPLENLRSFYKFTPLQRSARSKALAIIGNKDVRLEFGPGLRELNIGGTRCTLTHPVQSDAKGDYLISRTDMVKLIDPILRPTYIQGRQVVRTIILDPGHGGHDVGVQTPWIREADCTQLVAAKLRDELARRLPDVKILFTHEKNQPRSEQQRIDILSGVEAPIFISLHLNSGRSDVQGVETYTAAPAAPGEKPRPGNVYDTANTALAYAIQTALINGTEAKDGGCRRARYSLLNSLNCPSVSVELGYATHEEEAKKLATAEYQTKLAQALAEGICNYARMADPATKLAFIEPPQVEEPPTPVKADLPAAKATNAKKATKRTKAKSTRSTRKSTTKGKKGTQRSSKKRRR